MIISEIASSNEGVKNNILKIFSNAHARMYSLYGYTQTMLIVYVYHEERASFLSV